MFIVPQVRLRPVIYLPGDLVCRKGDIGKEMFILQSGKARVLGGVNGRTVLSNLGEGAVFGEIALLGVCGGMNKRTADVESVGFSSLFVLRKEDLQEVLKDYPDAARVLNARAQKLVRENEERMRQERQLQQDSEFSPRQLRRRPQRDPALLSTVLSALPETSMAAQLLQRGSKAMSISRRSLPDQTSSSGADVTWRSQFSLSQEDVPIFATPAEGSAAEPSCEFSNVSDARGSKDDDFRTSQC